MTVRAVSLCSGGLDSLLAISVLREQGIEVLGLSFTSPFFSGRAREHENRHVASAATLAMGVPIRVVELGLPFVRLVEKPRFGYGRWINPCIDCKIYMIRCAFEVMREIGGAFVATGEVLGQRPMTQNPQSLKLIERESGAAGRLLRPLSALLLEPTLPEQEGQVDRARLLAIQGRSRRDQLRLAREKRISLYSTPAGGCLLTDDTIERRLKDLFQTKSSYDMEDIKLLKLGRHFRIHAGLKAIVGRNAEENDQLLETGRGKAVWELCDHPGPLMLVDGTVDEGTREALGRLLRFYAKKAPGAEVRISCRLGDRVEVFTVGAAASVDEAERLRI